MRTKFYIIYFTLFCLLPAFGHNDKGVPIPADHYLFEENKGQLPAHVHYRASMGSKYLYIEEQGLTWHLKNEDDLKALPSKHRLHDHVSSDEHTIRNHVFKVHFKNSNPIAKYRGVDSSSSVNHYLRGQDPKHWARHVYSYNEIVGEDIYNNIDYKFHLSDGKLKYDFIIHPGGNPFEIEMEFEAVDTLFVSEGKLFVVTSMDTIVENVPHAYQTILGKTQSVECKFIVENKTVRFYISDAYNPNYKLVIDPELIFSTYTGSRADNWGMTATPGLNDEMFTGGIAFDVGYPTTMGAFQTTYNPGSGNNNELECDIVISKFSPDGSQLEYSTYLGGNASDVPHSIITNSSNELVVYGTTSSRDYPVTNSAYDIDFNGGSELSPDFFNTVNGITFRNGSDIIISVISSDGSDLVGSTFMGGNLNDGINNVSELPYNYGDQFRGEVFLDNNDNIYVASCTQSRNFPASINAISDDLGGVQDGCVFSLNNDCSSLRFSTYLGGSDNDAAYALKVAANGDIVIAGGTNSDDFPTTSSTIHPSYQGGDTDGFVTRLNNSGSNVISSTFIGTNEIDQVYLLTMDFNEDIYIAGHSKGQMMVSNNVFSNPSSGQFIQIISPDLSTVEKGTTFGTGSGEVDLSLTALMVDTCQRVFLSGWGGRTNNEYRSRQDFTAQSTTTGLTLTPDAFQSTTTGSDFYFLVLEKEFSDLIYASFFGRPEQSGSLTGDHVDGGTSRFSSKGVIYQAVCAGCRANSDFPTTPGAWSRRNNAMAGGECNLAAIKFDFQLSHLEANVDLVLDTFGCAPYDAEFINNSVGADEYYWSFGDGSESTDFSPSHVYDSIGQYDVLFIAYSNSSCLDPDTLELTIDIILAEPPNKDTLLVCGEPSVTLSSARKTPGTNYQWSDGSSMQELEVFESGVYSVTATESNCVFVDSFIVTITNPATRLEDQTLCGENEYTLVLDDRAENIQWSNGAGPNETAITVNENDLYTAEYNIGDCLFQDTANIQFPSVPVVEIMGRDTACAGESITLSIENKSSAVIENYKWSTGAITPSIEVTETGTYTITVVSDSSCTYEKEKFVYIIPALPDINIADTLLCRESEFVVDLSRYDSVANIIWNDGSTDPVREFTSAGQHSFTISTDCQTINESFALTYSAFGADERPFYIPNSFTPNSDAINDIFKIEPSDELQVHNFQMDVYDRWGSLVYRTKDHTEGWDGSFKNDNLKPGVFAYVIEINYFVCESPKYEKISADIAIQK